MHKRIRPLTVNLNGHWRPKSRSNPAQTQIGSVSPSAKYRQLGSVGNKRLVQFLEPTVLGWVSAQFVDINSERNTARVAVDALNFRRAPTVTAALITKVYRGYESQVFAQRNGFIQIKAPASLEVLIDENALAQPAVATDVPANSSSAGATTTQTLSEQTHLLAPGDSVSLLVFGEPDLSAQNVRVPQSGRVSFPLIGPVTVLGKTTAEVEQEVARLLATGYVRNPRLSVTIFSYRPIFMRGEVAQSGSFPFAEGLTVAKAIALAGGLSNTAKADGISLIRDGEVIAEGLSIDSQTFVASGDIVSVSADLDVQAAESSYIYLHGEVALAGAYEFQTGLTVEKAVVLAGGFTLRAAKKKISISRYEEASQDGEPKELKRVKLYTPVKPGDVIKVGARWF